MASEVTDKVRRAGQQMAVYLDEISKLFVGDVKLTLLVRHPGKPERNAFLSDDLDIDEICAAIRALHQNPTGGSSMV